MPGRIIAVSCAVLLPGAGLLIAGCSTSGGGSSSASSANAAAAKPAPARMGLLEGGVGHASGGSGHASSVALLAPAGQSIIYTASVTVQVRDAAAAAARASSAVTAAGGYTAAEQARTSQAQARARQRPRVSLTLKVPVAAYPATLRRLAGLGQQTALSQRSQDVTQQVADVTSRVTSGRDAISQLRTLLRRAGSVTGLLQVQNQISSDEATLEALLAQQRTLDHQTTYATISMLLLGPRPHAARAAAHHRHGFLGGLAAGWRGFAHTVAWLLTALGLILPFVVVIAALAALGYLGRRRLVRHRASQATTDPTAAS